MEISVEVREAVARWSRVYNDVPCKPTFTLVDRLTSHPHHDYHCCQRSSIISGQFCSLKAAAVASLVHGMVVIVVGTPLYQALVRHGSAAEDDIRLGHGGTGGDTQVRRRKVVFCA